MGFSTTTLVATTALLFLLYARPAAAFGAGNIASISRIEGQNFRHGDIEDVLLTIVMARAAGGRKFGKLDLLRVYFGNWLRDYSQAVDVGTVKYVSAEAIRILIWVLGFMSFGYATGEFEVTTERLGCYQPTEHIDNPLGYADGEDARRYDRRLRGPVDKRRELEIDPRSGLKNYIGSEDIGINTSSGYIRDVLGRCIQYGRQYARSGNKADLHEALRLLGSGLHCLEDYAAHSNYTELSLIELGERDVFPHVGRNVMIQLPGTQGPVYPIVTGTFGGVDFLHSVMGEFSDKVTQSEIENLEGMISDSKNDGPSEGFLRELLDKIPAGMFGGNDNNSTKMHEFQQNADNAQQHQQVSPLEPEEWTRYLNDVQRQIYPVLEWHDKLFQSINEAMESFPLIQETIEQAKEQLNAFVFSILAPYILPIIKQVKTELETGSTEVIQSSKAQQHNIFNDPNCSDPTHSMLSKDHFSNILNEPAGMIAQEVVKWAVPQIMQCWDDENIDVNRTLTRITFGVFHHPAYRNFGDDGAVDIRRNMFRTVEQWWGEKSERARTELRGQLSMEGVRNGRNHKNGVNDCGHGGGKPIALPKKSKKGSSSGGKGKSSTPDFGKMAQEAVGGGALGQLVGGFVSSGALGGGFGAEESHHKDDKYKKDKKDKKDKYKDEDKKYKYGDDDKKDKYKEDKKDKHKDDKKDKYKEDKKDKYKEDKKDKYKDYDKDKKDKKKDKKHDDNDDYSRGEKDKYTQQSSYGRGESYSTGYGQPQSGYGQSQSGYGQSQPGYGQAQSGYGQHSQSGYGDDRSRGFQTLQETSYGGHSSSSGYGQDQYQERRHEPDHRQERERGYGSSGNQYGGSPGGYGREQPQRSYGGGDQHGRQRSRSRSKGRESRQYQSGHHEHRDERRHSRERSHHAEDSYQRRYDKDSDDDKDDRRDRHHHARERRYS
ncbi:hypothetical protein FQN57_004473 [Myotisia sp. PD_48]|nr:hypothetical protein FQN57_004473 [Myotisia sp. PD_48]